MLVINAGNRKLIAVNRFKAIHAELDTGEKLRHGLLHREFLFYRFLRLLGILVVLSCTGNEFLEDAILQFKAHSPIVIYLRSQAFDKIRVVITRMELHKLHLFLLLICEQCIIVEITVADNISGDFFCKV